MGTILVVDDHRTTRNLLARLLRLEGYGVVTAENVWQALAVLETEPVSLVLLDFNLPGMDGDGLLAELSADTRFQHLPVIMVTAQRFDERLWQQHRHNLRDWMVKGNYDADELIASIEQNLHTHQRRLSSEQSGAEMFYPSAGGFGASAIPSV
jgi:two-component system chemotaxis sensor kinase CheA